MLLAGVMRGAPAFATSPSTGRSRLIATSLGTLDPEDVLWETMLLRLVSVCEAFVDRLFMDLMEEKTMSGGDRIRERLVEDVEVAASSNWLRRREAFERYHGLNLTKVTGWPKLEAAVAARNSVAHGLGRITATQRRSSVLRKKLSTIGVSTIDGRIIVSRTSVEVVYFAGREFVRGVDDSLE